MSSNAFRQHKIGKEMHRQQVRLSLLWNVRKTAQLIAHLGRLQFPLQAGLSAVQSSNVGFSSVQPLLCSLLLLLERADLDIGLVNDHLQLIDAGLQQLSPVSLLGVKKNWYRQVCYTAVWMASEMTGMSNVCWLRRVPPALAHMPMSQ